MSKASSNHSSSTWDFKRSFPTTTTDSVHSGKTVYFDYDRSVDILLLVVVLGLVGIGMLMVFSTTALMQANSEGTSAAYLNKHLISIALGGMTAWICYKVPLEFWKKIAPVLIGVSFVALLLVALLGKNAGGATRWVQIAGLRIQPGEFVKLAVVLGVASYASHFKNRLGSFVYGLAIPGFFLMGLSALFLVQPDFGSTSVMCIVAGTQLFLVVGLGHFLSVGLLAAGAAGFLVAVSPYRMRRFLAFLDPFSDPTSSGYQLIQSLIAVGSGGLFGEGLGVGRQKLFYLPAAHTDFIYAVIAEEFGMIGACTVLFLFLVILHRGLKITFNLIDDVFKSLLALGLTMLIVIPGFLNMGVVLGLLPTKGLVLPFISFGGTAMLAAFAALGILLRLSTEQKS